MKRHAVLFSTMFFGFATVLVAYGLFALSRFFWYEGGFAFDDRLILFDNGIYPFFWGVFLLLVGYLLRFQRRRYFMGAAACAGLVIFCWKWLTVSSSILVGQSIFPDKSLLETLIVVCGLILALALADRYIQKIIDLAIVRPWHELFRKR